ncbi:MAG TPA: hypothetical protein ENO03_06890, partial [Candidatus Aminicenantes bacterium]|nr:hypothetical protein [Candidatus Aminicenantes bacterium]
MTRPSAALRGTPHPSNPPVLPQAAASSPAQPLFFRVHAVVDTQGFGYEVFRMLIPKDWAFSGGLAWHFA